LEKAITRY